MTAFLATVFRNMILKLINDFPSGKTRFLHVLSYCFALQVIYFTFPNTTTMEILVTILYILVGNCITLAFKMVK
jgi:hypothetical protein